MSSKYGFLKRYVDQKKIEYKIHFENCLWSLDDFEEINDAEARIGFSFPESLKEFWKEVGIGHITTPYNAKEGYECSCKNEFLSPNQIADIVLLKEESELILPEVVEYMEDGYVGDGDILFFEIGDMSSFLMMKAKSSKPNAVYNIVGEIIEEDFEKFIWRLYHESPTYYLNVHN